MSTDPGKTEPAASEANAVALNGTTPMRWHPKVACRTLEGTAFILLDSRMVRLNEVGTRIWELFEEGSTVGDVVDRVASEFDVETDRVMRDADVFVRELLAKGMLVSSETQAK